MQLPEDVQCDSAMWRADGLVDLPEHGIPGVQLHML